MFSRKQGAVRLMVRRKRGVMRRMTRRRKKRGMMGVKLLPV
jgi:hypothetical protein